MRENVDGFLPKGQNSCIFFQDVKIDVIKTVKRQSYLKEKKEIIAIFMQTRETLISSIENHSSLNTAAFK